nr:hypothetical protein [Pleurocapsa sp. MO_226.B13]
KHTLDPSFGQFRTYREYVGKKRDVFVGQVDHRRTSQTCPNSVDRISLEMIYRGLYHFSVAHHKGLADDPLKYFTAPENQDLGIVKSIRKPPIRLILAPFPSRQKNSPDFFFSPSSQTLLTTALQA